MIRDEKSKALINNDVSALNKYKLESLSKEVTEIKKILNSVCEKLDKIESV